MYDRYAITDSAVQREAMRKMAQLYASDREESRKIIPIQEAASSR